VESAIDCQSVTLKVTGRQKTTIPDANAKAAPSNTRVEELYDKYEIFKVEMLVRGRRVEIIARFTRSFP
jgi:hypothetical protein